jgi:hypothetical protein
LIYLKVYIGWNYKINLLIGVEKSGEKRENKFTVILSGEILVLF